MEDKILDITALADIEFIDSSKAAFYILNDSFLGLKYNDKDYGRVSLLRTLPYKLPNEYISVSDSENKEIGIIRNVSDFTEEQVSLIFNELGLRYYCLSVKSIKSIKHKMGYMYFDIDTNAGNRVFALKDINKSLVKIGDERLLIIDVDGNRYMIEDMTALDRDSAKRIQPFIL